MRHFKKIEKGRLICYIIALIIFSANAFFIRLLFLNINEPYEIGPRGIFTTTNGHFRYGDNFDYHAYLGNSIKGIYAGTVEISSSKNGPYETKDISSNESMDLSSNHIIMYKYKGQLDVPIKYNNHYTIPDSNKINSDYFYLYFRYSIKVPQVVYGEYWEPRSIILYDFIKIKVSSKLGAYPEDPHSPSTGGPIFGIIIMTLCSLFFFWAGSLKDPKL